MMSDTVQYYQILTTWMSTTKKCVKLIKLLTKTHFLNLAEEPVEPAEPAKVVAASAAQAIPSMWAVCQDDVS